MDIDEKLISQQKYILEYFKAHAAQRLTTFNFYIIIFTFLCTGYALTFRHDILYPTIIRLAISILLILFAYVFYMLDKRNKLMIKNAEEALKCLELNILASSSAVPDFVHVFRYEKYFTDKLKSEENKNKHLCDFLERNLSYSNCFNIIFITGATIGVAGFIMSLVLGC